MEGGSRWQALVLCDLLALRGQTQLLKAQEPGRDPNRHGLNEIPLVLALSSPNARPFSIHN